LSFDPSVVVVEGPLGEMEGEERQSPVALLEAPLRNVNLKLLTFPFHLKTGTYVFTPYRPPGR